MILALLLLAGQLAHAEGTKPPQIDYKLQFEARTLESQLRELQQQFAAVQAVYAAKMEAMKQACGSYQQSVDSKTTEYVCVAKPEPTRNESGTWKGVTPPAR